MWERLTMYQPNTDDTRDDDALYFKLRLLQEAAYGCDPKKVAEQLAIESISADAAWDYNKALDYAVSNEDKSISIENRVQTLNALLDVPAIQRGRLSREVLRYVIEQNHVSILDKIARTMLNQLKAILDENVYLGELILKAKVETFNILCTIRPELRMIKELDPLWEAAWDCDPKKVAEQLAIESIRKNAAGRENLVLDRAFRKYVSAEDRLSTLRALFNVPAIQAGPCSAYVFDKCVKYCMENENTSVYEVLRGFLAFKTTLIKELSEAYLKYQGLINLFNSDDKQSWSNLMDASCRLESLENVLKKIDLESFNQTIKRRIQQLQLQLREKTLDLSSAQSDGKKANIVQYDRFMVEKMEVARLSKLIPDCPNEDSQHAPTPRWSYPSLTAPAPSMVTTAVVIPVQPIIYSITGNPVASSVNATVVPCSIVTRTRNTRSTGGERPL